MLNFTGKKGIGKQQIEYLNKDHKLTIRVQMNMLIFGANGLNVYQRMVILKIHSSLLNKHFLEKNTKMLKKM